MKFRQTTDLTELAPPGLLCNKQKPMWGCSTIYKDDYGSLRILNLKNLQFPGGTIREIPRMRILSDSEIDIKLDEELEFHDVNPYFEEDVRNWKKIDAKNL
jgi:hypothetical protein